MKEVRHAPTLGCTWRCAAAAASGVVLLWSIAYAQEHASAAHVDDLRAFAKLYGYVRFYHPSDEAAGLDWNAFAVYGSQQVLERGDEALHSVLSRLFRPIAPTLHLYAEGEAAQLPAASGLHSQSSPPADALRPVAWQHRGVGLGAQSNYASARTHRPTDSRGDPGFGMITQSVAAGPHRGQTIRLRAAVRVETTGPDNGGQLWLRVDRPERKHGFFDNMDDRRVTTPDWAVYEITGEVAEDAEQIVFGGFLKGGGLAWLDDFQLEVKTGSGWQVVPIANGDFQAAGDAVTGWYAASPSYRYSIDPAGAGTPRSVRIERDPSGRLFDTIPDPDEVVDKPIGAGLRIRMPLVVYSDSLTTLPLADRGASDKLQAALAKGVEDSRATWLGAVVVAWNVMQHFYPYWDVVGTDWDAELTRALRGSLDSADRDAFHRVFQQMMAALHDGHAGADHPDIEAGEGFLPVVAGWVEDQIVVFNSSVEEVRRGDIIVSIDGVAAPDLVVNAERSISGSPRWKRRRALAFLGRGLKDSTAQVSLRRGSEERRVAVQRTAKRWDLKRHDHEPFHEVEAGVFYLDLSRLTMEQIRERIADLAAARGIVFDLRGYPKNNHAVIQHLIDSPVQSARWNVPLSIYPDQERLVGYDTSGRWTLTPAQPRFTGKFVFLTGGGAISYAESVMGIIEHYGLAEIVGEPTAGANGNVNTVETPGGWTVRWTGMRVLKHDGSQHHLVGIQPTVPVQPTIAGVRDGRDEELEKALAIIHGS